MRPGTLVHLHVPAMVLLVAAAGLSGATRAWPDEETEAKVAEAPSTNNQPEEEATPPPDEKDMARYEQAMRTLREASSGTRATLDALRLLREEFPACRQIIVEEIGSGPPLGQLFAVGILGERGDPETDLPLVRRCLTHWHDDVRRAAITALQRLDHSAVESLLDCLAAETNANNRKIAVRAIMKAGDFESIFRLVPLLETEPDHSVRRHFVFALERITGETFGADVDAWKEFIEEILLERQTDVLMKEIVEPAREKEDEDEATK